MFVIENPSRHKVPIKVWLESADQLEPVCLSQAVNLANIPFLHQWVALMPDTHQGYGMPIGGVAALKDVLIPNAVGVDIGCGVCFTETDIDREKLTPELGKKLIQRVMERIPVGFTHQEKALEAPNIGCFIKENETRLKQHVILYRELEGVFYQLGTLGGGNHFIEFQEDECGKLALMVHSGSRNIGLKIANYFNEKAKIISKKNGWQPHVRNQLAFMPADSEGGRAYLEWMQMALLFARENRSCMMIALQDILRETFPQIQFSKELNVHHNYAALETHYGESVWVHRKGAIKVTNGELGIIPGAMGSLSFVVEGLGNPESFNSCSHGAGRHISRRQALKEIRKERVFQDLETLGVQVGTPNREGLVDESRFVYKDILTVMENQKDLIRPVKQLKSVLVVKG